MEIQEFLKTYGFSDYEAMKEVLSLGKTPILVQGSAGSGKTLRFLSRIAYQLKQENVTPESMLNLVYDAQCAKRMSKKYAQLFGNKVQPVFVDMSSFCFHIVQFYDANNDHSERKVYRDMEKAIRRILNDTFKVQMHRQELLRLIQKINECKMRMFSEKEIAEIHFPGIDFLAFYNAYEKFKKNHKIYDKADVIHEALHILMYDKEIVDLYRERFQYINIDDAQEMSYASHMIVRMLHAQKASLCAFMDEDQCIEKDYDPQPALFASWKEYYGEVIELKLTKNYRMNKTIAELASNFYFQNETTLLKANEEECDIKYKGFAQWRKMYDYAIRLASESEEETAFIYRESPYAIPLIDTFRTQQKAITFHCNIKKFLSHPVVKDLCNFITLFMDARNMKSFFEIHDRMGLDMSNKVLLGIDERIQKDENVDVFQAVMESTYKAAGKKKLASYMEDIRMVSKQSSLEMVQYVFDKLEYVAFMKEHEIDQEDAYVITFQILADRYPDPFTFMSNLKELASFESSEESPWIISDLNSIRGEEFSRVCLLDCFANVYPKPCRNQEERDFERRFFYTALTRAKNHLEFFTSKHCFTTRLEMSPYIFELHGKKESKDTKPKAAPITRLKEGDLRRGTKILHASLGEGKIKRISEGMMEVEFATETKMLNVKMCVQNKLVELV